MNWKKYLLEGHDDAPTKAKETVVSKFPDTANTKTTFPQNTVLAPETHVLPNHQSLSAACQPHLEKFIDMYQKGFDSLNKQGFDFYEFFQLVTEAGVDNAGAYAMAMKMAGLTDKSITKETLLQHADYYLAEINKVHAGYVTTGSAKKQEITQSKQSENEVLTNEVATLQQQLTALQMQLETTQNKLTKINDKYEPMLNEVDCKLLANDFAKNKLVQLIETVCNGIKTNLK